MYIRCSEGACQVINRVDKTAIKNHMRNGGKPVFACKGCKTNLTIMPLKAICSSPECGKAYRFYDFMLDEDNPVVICPHCQVKNKIKINIVPKELRKTGEE